MSTILNTLDPTQYYTHNVQAVSGANGAHDLQYKAAVETGQSFYRGALVTLNSSGNIIKGITTEHDMPMWTITGTDDYDFNGDIGNVSGGTVSAYVATGGYEIFTTEYVSATYAPNAMLCPATGGDAGKVKAAATAYSLKLVCGVVSKGNTTDIYSVAVLYFWPVYIPATVTS